MAFPVHLKLSTATAGWLADMLFLLAGEDESEAEGLLDMADSIRVVAEGRYDSATGAFPEHYEVSSP